MIRFAGPDDLPQLQSIEDAADTRLVDLLRPEVWERAPTGDARANEPGFLLVAVEPPGTALVGFVHVLEIDGVAHLEQVSVMPEHGRRGHGRALVEAAKQEAARRGHGSITLRTYAGVPWNAPFYATCGFVPTTPATPIHRGLERVEARLGLERWGRRVQMTAPLAPGAVIVPGGGDPDRG